MLPTLEEIENAAQTVYGSMTPTPQYRWPLLCDRLDAVLWIKHENHTPVGAFKVRGGLVYFSKLSRESAKTNGVICATRGNHGQSVAFAAAQYGIHTTVVVPHGNSKEKNAAMASFGAQLIEHGDDFQSSLEYARDLADDRGLHMVPSFGRDLVAGVSTYSLELFRAVEDLARVYVPIGLGSGICGMLAARAALGLSTEVIGVVSSHARAYAESFSQKKAVSAPVQTRLADGMACRVPNDDALALILEGVNRVVEVTDQEVAEAMRTLFECTHNVSEGAGAAPLAAAIQERTLNRGARIAVVLSGGNIDRDVFARVLSGGAE